MTTDTRLKMAAREVTLGGKTAIVSALCKGSGMLAPSLATTICLVTTDAAVTPKALQDALGRAVEKTLNMVTVDGDMSTNDCVLALANGLAGNARISEPGPDLAVLETALTDLLRRAGARDGRRRRGRDQDDGGRRHRRARPTRSPATARAPSPPRRWSRRPSSAPTRTGAGSSRRSARGPARRTSPSIRTRRG